MRKRCAVAIAGLAAGLALVAAPAAMASTEVGSTCQANELLEVSGGATVFSVAKVSGDSLPLTVPSAGVVTQWKVNLIPAPVSIPQVFEVLRPTGAPKQFQVVGETSGSVTGGQNTFPARLSVQPGDRFGLGGGEGPLVCKETGFAGDVIGAWLGVPPVGSTNTILEEGSGYQAPVSATIEPDADGDGFGDETQDKCPQSAAVQTPCPVVTLSTSGTAQKSLASVVVTSSSQASVTVAGAVKLGKGKTAKLSGGTQIVAPGAIAKFTLLFPAKVKAKLKQLSPEQHLTLSVAATAPNVVGAASASDLKVKLKGQAKPKRHKKPEGHA
jgi:hypothetical protein